MPHATTGHVKITPKRASGDFASCAVPDDVEQRLVDMQDQLQHLQRLASLGTVSAMLAHEINNILTPIVSYCQYALQLRDPALLATASEKTLKNARRLSDLCHRVLGLASGDAPETGTVNLRTLAREAVECLGRTLDKDNIHLTIDVPEDLYATAHASSLQQVLFNLVINARQAMLGRGSGRLTIWGRPGQEGEVRLSVADNGPGIRPENLPRIFEPFFTTKRSQERTDKRGVGLGLTICKQIIEEQGGHIEARSEWGKGACFILTLRAAEAPCPEPSNDR